MSGFSQTCVVRGRPGRFVLVLVAEGLETCIVRAVGEANGKEELVKTSDVSDIQSRSATTSKPIQVASPETSLFRECLEELRRQSGAHAKWESMQSLLLQFAFTRMRETPGGYEGEVFKDRDNRKYPDLKKEEHYVANLFHEARQNNHGLLMIGDEEYWLLGFEWPNQGGNAEKKRRADLVGMKLDGGLVIFECKLGANADPPAIAFAEGLDYASHLVRSDNAAKIAAGFRKWRNKRGQLIPTSFAGVVPKDNVAVSVILLAEDQYYEKHKESMTSIPTSYAGIAVSMGMAVCDFLSPTASWYHRTTS
ncbi:MAG: hypothetical protein KDA84_00280 [Planctomycetaceae bacterium]|nr:hypothetical protein [Planctomycetaceae bacterium]